MKLSSKIGLSAAVASVVIGPLLGVFVFRQFRAFLQEHIIEMHVDTARSVVREIDTALNRAYLDANVIAADELLADAMRPATTNPKLREQAMEELDARVDLTGPWTGMMVFDAAGHAVFTPKRLGRQDDISAYPAGRIAFAHAMRGEAYYSDRVISSHTGRPVVIFAAPIRDRDRVLGVVLGYYAWSPVQSILDHVDPGIGVYLLDAGDRIIAERSGSPGSEVPFPAQSRTAMHGGSWFAITPWHGQDRSLLVGQKQNGVEDYRGSGWTLVLEQPLTQAFAPITRLARDTAAGVVVLMLILAGIYALIVWRFMAPLSALLAGVRQVAGGDLEQKVEIRDRGEFGELADSFNDMVERLRERTNQLLAAQDELVRKEKLAVLGQVAGSVGHELRNPLGVMSNAVYYLQTVLTDADDGVREYLDIIRDEIAQSDRIVGDLLDSVRTKPPQPEEADITEMIGLAVRKCAIPDTVEVVQTIPDGVPPLCVDPLQIHQVLRNLISNAVDAMPDGGTLSLSVAPDTAACLISIEVRDTGSGMDAEQLQCVFQPLYTTKARGIGLGLVVVKNLTEANGGRVGVTSEPGKGTCFTITLPSGSPDEGAAHS